MKVKRNDDDTFTITATARFLGELVASENGAAEDYNPVEGQGAIEAVELSEAWDSLYKSGYFSKRKISKAGDPAGNATIIISRALAEYLTCSTGLLFHVSKWYGWAQEDSSAMGYVRNGETLQDHLTAELLT